MKDATEEQVMEAQQFVNECRLRDVGRAWSLRSRLAQWMIVRQNWKYEARSEISLMLDQGEL